MLGGHCSLVLCTFSYSRLEVTHPSLRSIIALRSTECTAFTYAYIAFIPTARFCPSVEKWVIETLGLIMHLKPLLPCLYHLFRVPFLRRRTCR